MNRLVLPRYLWHDSDDIYNTGDRTSGTPTGYDRVEYRYNRQGERIELKDQLGTVHEYTYDGLGRLLEDQVTTVGTDVDDSVLRIGRAYNVRGLVEKATSYTYTSGSAARNELTREYNDLGMLDKEYQEHEGTKDVNTLYAGYDYDETASGGQFTKGLRPTGITYPNGRVLHHEYSSGDDDNLGRVTYLSDTNASGKRLAQYTRLGLNDVVRIDFQKVGAADPVLRYNLAHGQNEAYDGLDRFDRLVDPRWTNYAGTTDHVRIKHGYDRASNRKYREDDVAANRAPAVHLDELYTYDGMYQLTALERGNLDGEKDEIVGGTLKFGESWGLDPTGNWSTFQQDTNGNGSWNLNQSRTHNVVNETTDITETVGPPWATPAHDNAGNMTTLPDPLGLTVGLTCKYDAWHRLVEVKDGADVVAQYEYDGLNRRVLKRVPVEGEGSASGGGDEYETDYYFHNAAWQVLETRRTDLSSASPDTLNVRCQYVWGLRYIDDLILRDRDADGKLSTGSQGKTGSGLEERLYALQDPNWNVAALANPSGAIQERYIYGAYGQPTVLTASFGSRSSSSYDWDHLYTGREYDPETGLYHYRNRYYHAQLARFISPDPIGYDGGDVNLYRYVGNGPSLAKDPLGLQSYAPGKATCRPTPNSGVQYVPGRGRFSQATLGPYDPEGDWITRLGSTFLAYWQCNSSDFVDKKGCCCCDKIRFIQIVAEDSSYWIGQRPWGDPPPTNWKIDGSIPYKYSSTVNPCKTPPGYPDSIHEINLRDMPNAPMYLGGMLPGLQYLRQRYETCVVCLSGGVTSRTKGITVYGCITWEHEVTEGVMIWSEEYYYTRTIGSTSKSGRGDVEVERYDIPAHAPSTNWKNAVLGK